METQPRPRQPSPARARTMRRRRWSSAATARFNEAPPPGRRRPPHTLPRGSTNVRLHHRPGQRPHRGHRPLLDAPAAIDPPHGPGQPERPLLLCSTPTRRLTLQDRAGRAPAPGQALPGPPAVRVRRAQHPVPPLRPVEAPLPGPLPDGSDSGARHRRRVARVILNTNPTWPFGNRPPDIAGATSTRRSWLSRIRSMRIGTIPPGSPAYPGFRLRAHAVAQGRPSPDVTAVDIIGFGPFPYHRRRDLLGSIEMRASAGSLRCSTRVVLV